MDNETKQFISLFQGRWDGYGDAGDQPKGMARELRTMHFERHLVNPDFPLGVYPLTDYLTVHWGCTDLDTGDIALEQARTLQRVFEQFGITTWREISKSKGAHLWLFAREWVPAETMRNAFLVAHQVAGIPATEVNPKQTTLQGKKLGNWVRLPYPGGLKQASERQVMIDKDDRTISFPWFVEAAFENRVELADLERVAGLYSAPVQKHVQVQIDQWSGDLEPLRAKLGGLANTIFCEGPLQARDGKQGRDRSSTLSRLAWLMASEGELSPTEAFVLLADADKRWGKFYGRDDCEEQLQRILDWAWSQ